MKFLTYNADQVVGTVSAVLTVGFFLLIPAWESQHAFGAGGRYLGQWRGIDQ